MDLPRPEVPVGATGEVARVLGAATHYEVLEVEPDAGVSRFDLTPSKFARKTLALLAGSEHLLHSV